MLAQSISVLNSRFLRPILELVELAARRRRRVGLGPTEEKIKGKCNAGPREIVGSQTDRVRYCWPGLS